MYNNSEKKPQVGDLIKGIQDNPYSETTIEMTKGKVIKVKESCSDDIHVKILEHTDSRDIGREYWVQSKYFDLIEATRIPVGSRVKTLVKAGMTSEGTVGTLENDDKSGRPYYVKFDDGKSHWYYENEIELYKEPDPKRFKVGDRVKCIKKFDGKIKVGDTGEIVDIGGSPSIGVKWDRDVGGHDCAGRCELGYGYYVNRENITLITQRDFKVCDRVKAIEADGEVEVGYIGTIVGLNPHTVSVEWDKNVHGHNCGGLCKTGYGWNMLKQQITLISEKPEFYVGQRVQFKEWEEAKHSYSFATSMKNLCGTYATIVKIHNEEKREPYKGISVDLKDFTATGNTHWFFNTTMFKPVDETPKTKETTQIVFNSILTSDEFSILSGFNTYKFIARDSDGKLFVYMEKPYLDIGGLQFYSKLPYREILRKDLFRFIEQGQEPVEINNLFKGGVKNG